MTVLYYDIKGNSGLPSYTDNVNGFVFTFLDETAPWPVSRNYHSNFLNLERTRILKEIVSTGFFDPTLHYFFHESKESRVFLDTDGILEIKQWLKRIFYRLLKTNGGVYHAVIKHESDYKRGYGLYASIYNDDPIIFKLDEPYGQMITAPITVINLQSCIDRFGKR